MGDDFDGCTLGRSAASQPVQRRRPLQRRQRSGAFRITTREYDELVKLLGGQRTLLDKKRCESSETAEIYRHQHTQYHGLPTVGAPEEDNRVIYDKRSTDLWVPNCNCFRRSSEHEANQAHTLSRTQHFQHQAWLRSTVAVSRAKGGKQALRETSLRARSSAHVSANQCHRMFAACTLAASLSCPFKEAPTLFLFTLQMCAKATETSAPNHVMYSIGPNHCKIIPWFAVWM